MEHSPFIKLRAILRKPGNPVVDCFVRCDAISGVSRADEEMIKVGAGSLLDTPTGIITAVESLEEVVSAIEHAEKAAV
jgi:hypothetical protein